MNKSIHICPVGFYPEPVIAVLGSGLPIDRIYFLTNDHERCNEAYEKIINTMKMAGIKGMERIEIDPYDYNDIVTKIVGISHNEKKTNPKTDIYINFTSGTNIVAGACCSTSYFIGAKLYYVMDKRVNTEMTNKEAVRIITTPKITDVENMPEFVKRTLGMICAAGDKGIFLSDLTKNMKTSPQRLNYHLNSFVNGGLITKEKVGRSVRIHPTEQGHMILEWAKG